MPRSDVCLLIPYFNAGDNLLDSLASVEAGSLRPDVWIVDDGSAKYPAASVLSSYEGALPIELITLPANRGIEHALNAGLERCVDQYPYIARLDCGDRCITDRLARQYAFMQAHPDCALLGSWANYVDPQGQPLFTSRPPVDSASIQRKIFLNSPFVHPSILIRSQVLKDVGFYPTEYPAAEDLALFFKIVGKYRTDNLPCALIEYVIDPGSISSRKRKTQIRSRILLILKHYDFSLIATVGLLRGVVTYGLPRRMAVFLNRLRESWQHKHSG